MVEQIDDLEPNWKKITALADNLDKAVDDGILKNEMSFIEIDIAFMIVKEKINEEKIRIINHMYKNENDNDTDKKSPPDGFYR